MIFLILKKDFTFSNDFEFWFPGVQDSLHTRVREGNHLNEKNMNENVQNSEKSIILSSDYYFTFNILSTNGLIFKSN